MVIVGGGKLRCREMIGAARLNSGCGFTAVNAPIGMLFVVSIVNAFGIVISHRVNMLGAVLCALPRHIVRADGNGIHSFIIVLKNVFFKVDGYLYPARRCVGIVDFVADTPADK